MIPTCVGDDIIDIKYMSWDPQSEQILLLIFMNGLSLLFDTNYKLITIF